MNICCVCGARPNFMKIAALVNAMDGVDDLQPFIVHTGQHYDERLSKVMFVDLGLPRPDVNLEVGSASQAVQTAEIMLRFEPVILEQRPDMVVVVGDVNSTVACSLVAVKLGLPVAHVEAGLRSFDREMPEEVNRLMTDALSHLLFVSERSGVDNLRREGVPDDNVFFVGNVMIDTLMANRRKAASSRILDDLELRRRSYAVLTLHRPSNVDDPAVLTGLLNTLEEVQRRIPVVFPIHPRTRARLAESGLRERVEQLPRLRLVDPLGYLDFLHLMDAARVLLTDSGGIQEEATVLGVPCLTLRNNTERPATLAWGFNRLVGTSRDLILAGLEDALARAEGAPQEVPEGWDGQAGRRIADILAELAGDRERLHHLMAVRSGPPQEGASLDRTYSKAQDAAG